MAHGVEARAAVPIGYGGLRDPLASAARATERALQLRGAARIPGVAATHAARGLLQCTVNVCAFEIALPFVQTLN